MKNTCLLLAAVSVAFFVGSAQAGTVAHYSFDNDFTDSSVNGLDGTAVGGVSITTAAGETVFGGGAANFSAAREYVSIPENTFWSGEEYTIAFWGRDQSPDRGGMAFGREGGGEFFLWVWTDYVRWRGNNADANRQADFTTTRDTDWHHYAIVAGDYDGDSSVDDITVYKDGNFLGTDPDNLTGFIYNSIGEAYQASTNLDWEGQIDEVWIFDNALSASAVDSLHSNNVVPEPTSVGLLLCGLMTLLGLRAARKR